MPNALDRAILERNLAATAQANNVELRNDIALLSQKLTGHIKQIQWMLCTVIAINIAVALQL